MVQVTKISPDGIDWINPTDRHLGIRQREDPHKARTEVNATLPFIGIDGEATNNGNDYCLLTCGSESHYHKDSRILGLDEIFSFLYAQYEKNPTAIFVGFFLGYDFAKWLQHLPEERARMLFSPEGIAKRQRRARHAAPFAVRWKRWEFDILGLKRFKLRPYIPWRKNRKDDSDSRSGWMYICDAGPFFQTSFLKAIDPTDWPDDLQMCSPEEYEKLRTGKARRATATLDAEMIEYNQLEMIVLSRLMNELRKGFQSIGINLSKSQWFGPGQVASKWLAQHKEQIPDREDREEIIPGFAHKTATAAYYGGWFEVFMHGNIPGTVYEYDINSAYPSEIEKLPCLLHGTWREGIGKPPDEEATIRFLTVRMTSHDKFVGVMPYRGKEARIQRPLTVTGTYLEQEIRASQRALRATVDEYISWVSFQQQCECPPPLRDIRSLYEKRQEIIETSPAKKKDPRTKALKLTYNSPYGKFAESVGDRPRWSNAVYASLITAGTRVRILDAIASHPHRTRDLAMVATDAVYFTSRHPGLEPEDPDKAPLGDWSAARKHNLTVVMPGMYWDDDQRKTGKLDKLRSRGVSAHALSEHTAELDRLFEIQAKNMDKSRYNYDWPVVLDMPIPFTIVTPRLALNQNRWDQAGFCQEGTRTLNSHPWSKRDPSSVYKDAKGIVRTLPYRGDNNPPSRPYDRSFGRTIEEQEESEMTIDGPALLLREDLE